MKLTHYIYISAALALLTSCGEDIEPVYTVGEADNAIVLQAGVADGMQKMQTRGGTRAAGNPTYVAFQTGTKMALYVEGTWLGHTDANGDASEIKKPTTGKIKSENTSTDRDLDGEEDSNQETDTRGITLDPQLYWDDYGTADPNNMPNLNTSNEDTNTGNGRSKGLTIYGAAVDGVTTAPEVTTWNNITWNVGTPDNGIIDQNTTEYWKEKDLLTSNNISGDNTLKFETRTTGNNNILYFTHEMTKITVILTAGAGFNSKFAEDPSVTLENFNYTGVVNAIEKKSTPTDNTKANIKMKLETGGGGNGTATFTALAFPGNKFENTDRILTLSADYNNYEVTATNLNAAIQKAITNKETTKYPGTDNTLLHAYNYILKITVNKTAIAVEATIVNWQDIEAANETPKIKIEESYGVSGSEETFGKDFDFVRSTDLSGSYWVDGNYARVSYDSSKDPKYSMTNFGENPNKQLYWPTHDIHYFFRGIWPLNGDGTNNIPDNKYNLNSINPSAIEVENVKYTSGTYPSDLMIGRPLDENGDPDETCKVVDHKKDDKAPEGICATEGKINLNFHYMMSQVVVNLKTSLDGSNDKITFNEFTKVQILGGYKDGRILVGSCTPDFTDRTRAEYDMNRDGSVNITFHDAIIPQSLVDNMTDKNPVLKFQILVKDSQEATYDKYETIFGISDIPVKILQADGNWSNEQNIYSWEPGKKYIYNLTMTKTGIKIEATITDWIKVQGSTTIWM